jgi:hypothetical protein
MEPDDPSRLPPLLALAEAHNALLQERDSLLEVAAALANRVAELDRPGVAWCVCPGDVLNMIDDIRRFVKGAPMTGDWKRGGPAPGWTDFRLGDPVIETGESGFKGELGTIVESVSNPGTLSILWTASERVAAGLQTGITGGARLDWEALRSERDVLVQTTGEEHDCGWRFFVPGQGCMKCDGFDRLHYGDTPEHLDAAIRRFVALVLPADWGEVEGAIAHRSHRGYVEVHVWTTKLHGRALQISIGDRITTRLPIPFPEFEERRKTKGFDGYCVGLRVDESKMTRLEAIEAAISVVEAGGERKP